MILNGTYTIKYLKNRKEDELLVEVKLKMHEDPIKLNENIYYGEVYVNLNLRKELRVYNWVNAVDAVEYVGLKLKKELLDENPKIKILEEKITRC